MTALDAVLGRLAGVRASGGGYTARCPAHDDTTASLSVGCGDDGRVLLRCHAGCTAAAVTGAVGLAVRDLFADGDRAPAPPPRETVYVIRDVDGTPVAEHVRVDRAAGKQMWWRLPGATRAGLGGRATRDLPLYGAHRLGTVAADAPIVVAEGERATDALQRRGIAAVGTVTGASGTPSDAVLGVLAGRDVVLWPDADDTGRAHMTRIATRLTAAGGTPRWLTVAGAADGDDAADVTVDDDTLRAWVADAPAWTPGTDDGHAPTHPDIVASGRPLRDIAGDAVAALAAANTPPHLYMRGGRLVRVRRDERNTTTIELVGEAALRGRLARVADWSEVRQLSGGEWRRRDVPPPVEVVRDVLALPELPFPGLEAIVEAPVLRADGTVLAAPGYDAATRLLYAPRPGWRMPDVPTRPTPAEMAAARALVVDDLLGDFPFASLADRANCVGLLLTPLVRPAVAGGVPLALVDKPSAGTGASLLAEIVALIATGRPAAMMTAPRDDDEWRKKLTSALLPGPTVIAIDNVVRPLASADLAAVLTADVWVDRLLGGNEMVRLPQRATWLATGNNLRVAGDIARRSYWIRLDARVSRPWQRDGFRRPDLRGWVAEARGDLLAALLTLARAWWAAGCPAADVPAVGGFAAWARVVGGVLATAGIDGYLANLATLYDQVDEEASAWDAFTAAWAERYGDQPVTVATVTADLRDDASPLREALPGPLEAVLDGRGFGARLGTALTQRADRVFAGDLRLERVDRDSHSKVARWRIVRIVRIVSQLTPRAREGTDSSHGDVAGTVPALSALSADPARATAIPTAYRL